jgi:hypothetical protein
LFQTDVPASYPAQVMDQGRTSNRDHVVRCQVHSGGGGSS